MPMPHIFSRSEIESVILKHDVLREIEHGFALYSVGEVTVPPISSMRLYQPLGDVQVKMGYVEGDPYYVVKVASGFFDNPKQGLPSSNGVMMLFERQTGMLAAILLDEGLLTDIRSAAAGAVAAKYLAPQKVTRIGIIGTGVQARLQPIWLQEVLSCTDLVVWGRSEENLKRYVADMPKTFNIRTTLDINDLTSTCNLIITTTASAHPLIFAEQLQPGTHITALGADATGKQELDVQILYKADIVVADSISQCVEYGEIAHATELVLQIRELGSVIENPLLQRQSDMQLSVADLTGVAVQDAKIASLVYQRLLEKGIGR